MNLSDRTPEQFNVPCSDRMFVLGQSTRSVRFRGESHKSIAGRSSIEPIDEHDSFLAILYRTTSVRIRGCEEKVNLQNGMLGWNAQEMRDNQ